MQEIKQTPSVTPPNVPMMAPVPAPEIGLGGIALGRIGGGGSTIGPPAPANVKTPCPEAATTWLGDSGYGTSGNSVLAIAPVTPEGAVGVMITGANGGIPAGAKEKLPGGTTTVCPPDVNATFPELPMFATPVPPTCSSATSSPWTDTGRTVPISFKPIFWLAFSSIHTTKYVPRAAATAVGVCTSNLDPSPAKSLPTNARALPWIIRSTELRWLLAGS